MEILKLNESQIRQKFAEGLRLKEIISNLEKSLEPQGRVICRVKVNGLTFSEADEGRFADTQTQDIHEIEIETEALGSLLLDSIEALKTLIVNLREATIDTSEQFRSGVTPTAMKLFTEIMSNAQWLIEALMALKPNLKPEDAFEERWSAIENHTITTVRELMTAYEHKDYILLSDVLEYEFYTSLDNWLELLKIEAEISKG